MRNPLRHGFKIYSKREGYFFILGYFGIQKGTPKVQRHEKVLRELQNCLKNQSTTENLCEAECCCSSSPKKYSILIPLLKPQRVNKQLQS